MRSWSIGVWLLILCFLLCAGAAAEAGESNAVSLRLIPTESTGFTNAVAHYVYFNAEVENATKLVVRLYSPSGDQRKFQSRKQVASGNGAKSKITYPLKNGQKICEGMNVLFNSDTEPGTWVIEVTAEGEGQEQVKEQIEVVIRKPDPLVLNHLADYRSMLTGIDGGEVLPVEAGKIRYIAQNPKDNYFVDDYWLSKAYDLRKNANSKCTRAVFSMALSFLGIDCTPIRMSEMLKGTEIIHTFDPVCKKLGDIYRVEGDLETLWDAYESGSASPVLIHFTFTFEGEDGMHAVLLIGQDPDVPGLYYAVTTGQRANTTAYPDGLSSDPVIPILIDKGEVGQWIQSPLVRRYNRGHIDAIWQWRTN